MLPDIDTYCDWGADLKSDGMHALCGLNEDETAQLHALAAICRKADGVNVKFNYSMVANRKSGEKCDFCWFHSGRLVAYAPLDRFGSKGEITAAVHPEHRRQGIFANLYTAAVTQARCLKCTELLLVGYRASNSGGGAVRKLGLNYKFSEYCMKVRAADVPPTVRSEITLVDVKRDNAGDFARMMAISFPDNPWSAPQELEQELRGDIARSDRSYYLAQLQGRNIGHIGVLVGADETYIRAVGIMPEWRRRGYGSQMLAETLSRQIAAGATNFELDVATENEGALKIYTSCGFRTSNIYDYYTIY